MYMFMCSFLCMFFQLIQFMCHRLNAKFSTAKGTLLIILSLWLIPLKWHLFPGIIATKETNVFCSIHYKV